jgi:Glycogen recognition site of AMP-activated protein kinase
MGNSPSRPQASGAASHAASTSANHAARAALNQKREPRRRGSIHALSQNPKATARPSPSLENAHVQPTPVSLKSAKDALRTSAEPQPQPQPATTRATPHLKPLTPADKMGNQESKQSEAQNKGKVVRPSSPKPVPIPASGTTSTPDKSEQQIPSPLEALPLPEDDLDPLPPSEYNRPPRLPLPIEEEVYAPGSPIISPADLTDAVVPLEGSGLPRRTSVLSATTVDEDEEVVEELQNIAPSGHPGVPTFIEWRDKAERVYITGTFADWDRKIRLHRK